MVANCSECSGGDDEGLVLLCDECDRAVHALCHSKPFHGPLLGDWVCDRCVRPTQSVALKGRVRKKKRLNARGMRRAGCQNFA